MGRGFKLQTTFSGYYRLDPDTLRTLWKEAMIALDANVLLNLHRYPTSARNDLLTVLRLVAARLFVPYQAGLEYQRRRLSVIASQIKRFEEVRKLLLDAQNQLDEGLRDLKKRHASINPEALLTDVGQNFDSFRERLESLEREHPDVAGSVDNDSVREALNEILKGKIGPIPTQGDLDSVYKSGQERYKYQRPPGYLDSEKAKEKESVYFSHGLRIERQFGDLLVWEQVLSAAAERKMKHLILVTDDEKEDWWWVLQSKGRKTIGPRPELIEEAQQRAGVSAFYMYNSERFITFAQQYLGATVQPESIEQIKASRPALPISAKTIRKGMVAEHAVFDWLNRIHQGRSIMFSTAPCDFIVELDGNIKLGYEVRMFNANSSGFTIFKALRNVSPSPGMDRLYIVFVAFERPDPHHVDSLLRGIQIPPWVRLVFGHLETELNRPEPLFVPDFERPVRIGLGAVDDSSQSGENEGARC